MSREIEILLERARTARRAGRLTEAREAWAQAAVLAQAGGHPMLEAGALRHLSDLDREAGRGDAALASARRACALYEGTGRPLDLANALRLTALALDALSRPAEARTAWTRARDLYAAANVTDGVAECEARLRD